MTAGSEHGEEGSVPTWTRSDLLAVLIDVERRLGGSFMERSITRGLLLGPPICLVASVILGNLLVLAGPHRSEAFSASINGWTGTYGFFLGVFLGPIVDAVRKEKKEAEATLDATMTKFQLSPSDVDRTLRANEKRLPKTAGAFARLKRTKNW